METFGEKIIKFYASLHLDVHMKGITVMNPYQNTEVFSLNRKFALQFFHDTRKRIFLFGINPGRFGAGVTGIAFTDPVRLAGACHIPNALEKKPELSSVFIYKVIDAFGGPQRFYARFFLTAVCPLGFIKEGKNLNYYDLPVLRKKSIPFIVKTMHAQMRAGAETGACICIGEGENYRHFCELNGEHGFFSDVHALPHPRWIMQYRRKKEAYYVHMYTDMLRQLSAS